MLASSGRHKAHEQCVARLMSNQPPPDITLKDMVRTCDCCFSLLWLGKFCRREFIANIQIFYYIRSIEFFEKCALGHFQNGKTAADLAVSAAIRKMIWVRKDINFEFKYSRRFQNMTRAYFRNQFAQLLVHSCGHR
jgi:hypothetical protein